MVEEYKFKYLIFSIISGVFLALAFQKFNFFFLAWIAFIPLLYCIYKNNLLYSALFGFIMGLIFNVMSTYWFFLFLLSNTKLFFASFFVSLILWVYLSAYFVIWSIFVNAIKKYNSVFVITLSAALFAVFDCLKSYLFSGFQTNILGYSQACFSYIIQAADIFGVYFISFFIILINMMLFYFLVSKKKKILLQFIISD